MSENKTGLVYHEDFAKHRAAGEHPERPERLRAIWTELDSSGLIRRLTPLTEPVQPELWIRSVHSAEHIAAVMAEAARAPSFLDPDTYVSRESARVAELAVSLVLGACSAVVEGKVNNAFCAVRPPGHHAESSRPMGFCLYNNVAIAARYLQKAHGLARILIVDWDVHHGNGTQEIFYDDKSVFYFSTHQFPHYPGTGSRTETGRGEGLGTTLNSPLQRGAGDAEVLEAFTSELVPATDKFQPDFVLVSAGFDAHADDPLAGLAMTEDGYARLTHLVRSIAAKHCQGRLVSVLEGGYSLPALGRSVRAHVEELLR